MAIVLDSSIVVALIVADEPEHEEVKRWVFEIDDDLVTTPLALAEMSHVVERRAGHLVAARMWQDFERGAYQIRWWADALSETIEIARVESRLSLGLVDASLVALAERLNINRIATLDHRHFRLLTVRRGAEHFVVLPADA